MKFIRSFPLFFFIPAVFVFEVPAYEKPFTDPIDGLTGKLIVKGILTESPCDISFSSLYQEVDFGVLTINMLDLGRSIPVSIEFKDCIKSKSYQNSHLNAVSSYVDEPVIELSFYGDMDLTNPDIYKVYGAEGFGLSVLDSDKNILKPYVSSKPKIVGQGDNKVFYYIKPVKNGRSINSGPWGAIVNFRVQYE
ncbi:hypothetical protein [Enterobacter kobei]|uniref:fimbrial protein n=1 Tax=Enterobacter kobei TaxID=208224 RepID=UPI002FCFB230